MRAMTETGNTLDEAPRSEARRNQVLDAATECFLRDGFHGASMAQISKAAGMSVGHIYHYFENKDAIIAAIVERDLQNTLTITRRLDEISRDGDLFHTMIEEVDYGVDQCMGRRDAALMLEVVVEAARNPRIAEIVRRANETVQARFQEQTAAGHRARGRVVPEREIRAQVEVMSALFEGLTIRTVRNPDFDKAAIVEVIRRAMRGILDL